MVIIFSSLIKIIERTKAGNQKVNKEKMVNVEVHEEKNMKISSNIRKEVSNLHNTSKPKHFWQFSYFILALKFYEKRILQSIFSKNIFKISRKICKKVKE